MHRLEYISAANRKIPGLCNCLKRPCMQLGSKAINRKQLSRYSEQDISGDYAQFIGNEILKMEQVPKNEDCHFPTPVSNIEKNDKAVCFLFFFDAPPAMGQWEARRSTGGYNTRHDIFAPWAGINEDLLYAHALATDHTWYGMDWDWLERH